MAGRRTFAEPEREAVNVMCIDVKELIRRNSGTHWHSNRADGDAEAVTPPALSEALPSDTWASRGTTEASAVPAPLFMQGPVPDRQVKPPVSPADPTVLEDALQHPERTLSECAAVRHKSRFGFRVQPPLNPLAASHRQPFVDVEGYRNGSVRRTQPARPHLSAAVGATTSTSASIGASGRSGGDYPQYSDISTTTFTASVMTSSPSTVPRVEQATVLCDVVAAPRAVVRGGQEEEDEEGSLEVTSGGTCTAAPSPADGSSSHSHHADSNGASRTTDRSVSLSPVAEEVLAGVLHDLHTRSRTVTHQLQGRNPRGKGATNTAPAKKEEGEEAAAAVSRLACPPAPMMISTYRRIEEPVGTAGRAAAFPSVSTSWGATGMHVASHPSSHGYVKQLILDAEAEERHEALLRAKRRVKHLSGMKGGRPPTLPSHNTVAGGKPAAELPRLQACTPMTTRQVPRPFWNAVANAELIPATRRPKRM